MIFKNLEQKRKELGTLSFALIDPDQKNDQILPSIMDSINKASFDSILVGGSMISDDKFEERITYIKSSTDLPVIIFPGGSDQVSSKADAILFTSLISGRNPQYLIEEQVNSSLKIYNHSIEPIPTGYILLQTDKKSAVEIISNTKPLPMNDIELITSHALAAQYLGKSLLFLEAGSNSNYPADTLIIKKLASIIDIPIMVGGGIKDLASAELIAKNGASYIVIGSLIEEGTDYLELLDINNAIHNASNNEK